MGQELKGAIGSHPAIGHRPEEKTEKVQTLVLDLSSLITESM
jgi:hypothetical protein